MRTGEGEAPIEKGGRSSGRHLAIGRKKFGCGVREGDGDCRAEPASQLGSWRPRRWNGFPFGRARQRVDLNAHGARSLIHPRHHPHLRSPIAAAAMSFAASRAVLRHSRFAMRRPALRNASTTSEAAKEKASQATSKAAEGLSRASASGTAALQKASQFGGAALQRLASAGGRTAKVAGFVQCKCALPAAAPACELPSIALWIHCGRQDAAVPGSLALSMLF